MTDLLARPAYSCADPTVVAAFRTALAEYTASERAALAAVSDIPGAKGIHYALGQGGIPDHIIGVIPSDERAEPPAGWRVRGRRRTVYWAPHHGPAGEVGQKWIRDHQLRNDPRLVLRGFGLPQNGRRLTRKNDGSSYVIRPVLFEHEGTIWVMYAGTPVGAVDGRWEAVRMSAWHAAREAYDDAQQTTTPAGTR